ncbi:MAG: Na/Pi cotransporter family protein [Clostridiales bacterium]|nr:Na/Pi cotransporter family protein [Clostridiales bacterium]
MSIFYTIIAFLGGLAMFLYGMRIMGDGLKSSSSGALRTVLAKVTNKPVMGFLLGMLTAAIIQSSTATIVITVGLVGAGLLTFHQSIGIVLGANVGTAITAQVIRLMDVSSGMDSPLYFFKADNLAPLALVIGIVMIMFVRKSSAKTTGNIACGFGILFMGLIYMSDVVSGFGDQLSYMLTAFQNNYFLGFLAGVLVTGVVQSSSAVIGIIQSVASSIGVNFQAVFAVIIGVNIGDCLTTFLVSRIGAKPSQRRTAVVHIVYNVFAAVLISLVVFICRETGLINDDIWTMTLNSGGVANLHGIFRLVPAIVLLPLTPLFERITLAIVHDEPIDAEDKNAIAALDGLDERFFTSPPLALDQVERILLEMSDIAQHNFDACVKQIYDYDPKRDQRIQEREDLLDRMTDAANKYIVSLSPHVTRDIDTRRQNALLKVIICYERIGDLAVNISEEVIRLKSDNKSFSPNAMAELRIGFDAVYEILHTTTDAYRYKNSELAAKVEPLEEVIDDLIEGMNARHVYRMVNHLCDAVTGIYYQAILTNIEHISDKCSDIAVYVMENDNAAIFGHEHTFVHDLHHSNNADYLNAYQRNYDKYFGSLEEIPVTNIIEEEPDNGAQVQDSETDKNGNSGKNSRGKSERKSRLSRQTRSFKPAKSADDASEGKASGSKSDSPAEDDK